MDIEKYKINAENFLSELDKEYYLHFAGLKEELNIGAIYNKYGELFLVEYFNLIKELKDKTKGEDRKKYSYLLKFCGETLIEMPVKELIDEMGEDEAKAIIEIEGKEVSYRYSEVLLSNEPDKAKRDSIDEKRNKLVEKQFNPKLCMYWDTLHKQAGKLGFESYKDMFSYLKGVDLSRLKSDMERLLEATHDLYIDHFGKLLLSGTGIELGNSRKSDFAYLKRAARYDVFFKKERLVELFKQTLASMGIDLDRQKNIFLDVEERKNKSPRAFCSTVKIPGEIYLVLMPKGGQDDFEAMFHEGGHAEHFSNTRPSIDFEYKFLGDNAVTEGYAFAMENLMQNKEWLVYFLKMSSEDAREFVYFSNVSKLWFCRRYGGKLKYELVLHGSDPISGKDAIYKEILVSANLMQYSGADYLKDVDDGFYCANYIRAWIFEAQLKDHMHQKFGHGWFRQKKAGDFLKELWSYGQKYDPVEILQQLGYKDLDVNYLIDSLIEEINKNK
jgi:hypothetical protein